MDKYILVAALVLASADALAGGNEIVLECNARSGEKHVRHIFEINLDSREVVEDGVMKYTLRGEQIDGSGPIYHISEFSDSFIILQVETRDGRVMDNESETINRNTGVFTLSGGGIGNCQKQETSKF